MLFLHDSAETVFNDYNWLRSPLFFKHFLFEVFLVFSNHFQLDFGLELLKVEIRVFVGLPIRIDKVEYVIFSTLSVVHLSLNVPKWWLRKC